jgi:8-oxo-dGTP pyrophosphatase MutT (NUDIX family)
VVIRSAGDGLLIPEAVVAVIRRGGRVLVIQRGPASMLPGYWSPPSGRIEPGESQEQAVVREMHEELGLAVHPVARVWECLTDDGHYRLHWWTVAEDGGVITPDADEVGGTRWVDAAGFAALSPTFAGDREFFRDVFPALA